MPAAVNPATAVAAVARNERRLSSHSSLIHIRFQACWLQIHFTFMPLIPIFFLTCSPIGLGPAGAGSIRVEFDFHQSPPPIKVGADHTVRINRFQIACPTRVSKSGWAMDLAPDTEPS